MSQTRWGAPTALMERYAQRPPVRALDDPPAPDGFDHAQLGFAAFDVILGVTERVAGSLVWSRNITRAIHRYPAPATPPGPWTDWVKTILLVDCVSGLSSAYAFFTCRWRANGHDIDQCRVELDSSNDWSSSTLRVSFEGSDAASSEQNGVAGIMLYMVGSCDPVGTGDCSFASRILVRGNGTVQNQSFSITRGDESDWTIEAFTNDGGYTLKKR